MIVCVGGRGYWENLLVCKIYFCTAIVRVVFVLRKSSFSIFIPLRITSSFFPFVKVFKVGNVVFNQRKQSLTFRQVKETVNKIM